ncbi:hypothetical protein D5S17_33795 [Pseudonocardiaceae bacterium YIM PH 21723]|nr:hypothetical protein D5S17_33795 [Pseudonocardiaceae bacterium YIM PH 21723]
MTGKGTVDDATKALIQQNGWGFYEHSERPQIGKFQDKRPGELSPEDSCPVWDLITGTYRGQEFFSYVQRESDGDGDISTDSSLWRYTGLRTPGWHPRTLLTRADFFLKLARVFGVRGVRFDDPEFTKVFQLTSTDTEVASATFSPDVRRWLLADGRARKQDVRILRDEMIVYDFLRGKGLAPDRLLADLDFLVDLRERLPAGVWR